MRGPRFVLIVCACLVQLLIGRAANIPIGSFRECIRCEPRCDGRWTGFFDRDNPSGQGDYELLADLKRENPGQICDTPSAVYAETLNRLSAELTGENVHMSPTTGFSCVNDQQSDGRCQDYRVKFCCPVVSECNGRWTGFFDRDNPGGTGDWEDLNSLRRENPGQICENPSGVYAETLSGVSAALTGETINLSPTHGFSCVNDQQNDGRCQDYRVKFCCPAVVSECNGRWTRFFDRDNPGGTGDWEDLNSLRRENPGQICENPSGVYAETLNGVSAALTGETVNMSPTHGFSCVNDQQSDGRCQDYRVKFCC